MDWFISSGITSVNESLQASNFLWMINIFRIIPIFSHVYLFWVVTYNVTILFSHRNANHSFPTSFVAEQINPFNIPYSVIYPNKNVTTTTRQENVKKINFQLLYSMDLYFYSRTVNVWYYFCHFFSRNLVWTGPFEPRGRDE